MSAQARQQAFGLACLLVGAVVALLALTREEGPRQAEKGTVERAAAGRPEVAAPPGGQNTAPALPPSPSPPRLARTQVPGPAEVERAAQKFAGDWLDYLDGERPVSAVRHIEPKLTLGFAGGDAPRVGPGRAGLGRVSCRGQGARRYRCSAAIAGLEALRFVMSTDLPGERVQVSTLALD